MKPICVAHKWNVQMLEEFVPPNAGLLGMNVNRKKIFIRLRPASDLGESLHHRPRPRFFLFNISSRGCVMLISP